MHHSLLGIIYDTRYDGIYDLNSLGFLYSCEKNVGNYQPTVN